MSSDPSRPLSDRPRHTRRHTNRHALLALTIAAAASVAVSLAVLPPTVAHAAGGGVTADTERPEHLATPDAAKIEIGLKFSPTTSGTLSGVQFYQNANNAGVTSASVWSSSGALLTQVAVNPTASVGWRTVPVDVALVGGTTYTVSVFDSNGKHPATEDVFTEPRTVGEISTPANAGVYRYGRSSAFPSQGQSASLLVDVLFTAAAAPAPEPAQPVSPSPAPSPTQTTSPTPPVTAPQPTGSVYGPDGTHWPQNTPRADAARRVNVAASWSAIASAITANAKSADAVVICVAPGTITGGNGAGSTAKGVLQNIGDAARASRILVSACEGVGTVKVAAGSGVAFVGVSGVSIIGIDFSAQSVMVRNSQAFAIGYSKVPQLMVTANGGTGVRDVEIIEIVAGSEAVNGLGYDRAEVKSAGGYSVDGLRFAGFYAAPHYKPNGSRSHVDTLQFVTTSGSGTITNVTIDDSVLFQSSDQGMMVGGNGGGAITHSAFFGGTSGQLRYPMYAGGDPITLSNLLHGTWIDLNVTGAIVAGSISSSYSFSGVVDSSSNAGTLGFSLLNALTLADIDRLAPKPTEARLKAIWG